MSEEQKIRVVIADDQALVRAGFAMVIASFATTQHTAEREE